MNKSQLTGYTREGGSLLKEEQNRHVFKVRSDDTGQYYKHLALQIPQKNISLIKKWCSLGENNRLAQIHLPPSLPVEMLSASDRAMERNLYYYLKALHHLRKNNDVLGKYVHQLDDVRIYFLGYLDQVILLQPWADTSPIKDLFRSFTPSVENLPEVLPFIQSAHQMFKDFRDCGLSVFDVSATNIHYWPTQRESIRLCIIDIEFITSFTDFEEMRGFVQPGVYRAMEHRIEDSVLQIWESNAARRQTAFWDLDLFHFLLCDIKEGMLWSGFQGDQRSDLRQPWSDVVIDQRTQRRKSSTEVEQYASSIEELFSSPPAEPVIQQSERPVPSDASSSSLFSPFPWKGLLVFASILGVLTIAWEVFSSSDTVELLQSQEPKERVADQDLDFFSILEEYHLYSDYKQTEKRMLELSEQQHSERGADPEWQAQLLYWEGKRPTKSGGCGVTVKLTRNDHRFQSNCLNKMNDVVRLYDSNPRTSNKSILLSYSLFGTVKCVTDRTTASCEEPLKVSKKLFSKNRIDKWIQVEAALNFAIMRANLEGTGVINEQDLKNGCQKINRKTPDLSEYVNLQYALSRCLSASESDREWLLWSQNYLSVVEDPNSKKPQVRRWLMPSLPNVECTATYVSPESRTALDEQSFCSWVADSVIAEEVQPIPSTLEVAWYEFWKESAPDKFGWLQLRKILEKEGY